MCTCAACHVTFTSPSAFDMHQRLTGGGVVCADPGTAIKPDGSPTFKVCRRTPDGEPVWGSYRPDLPGRGRARESDGTAPLSPYDFTPGGGGDG